MFHLLVTLFCRASPGGDGFSRMMLPDMMICLEKWILLIKSEKSSPYFSKVSSNKEKASIADRKGESNISKENYSIMAGNED